MLQGQLKRKKKYMYMNTLEMKESLRKETEDMKRFQVEI